MPVEIKELVIRAVAQSEAAADNRAEGETEPEQKGCGPEEGDAIVAAAVRQVLRILRATKER